MKISLIAAIDQNNGIGLENEMPWHLPEDFKHFKAMTMGKPIIMGRKTAQSLGRTLPGRNNWVLTRQQQAPFEGQSIFPALAPALDLAQNAGIFEEVFIIGGGQVYAQSIDLATDLYITHVQASLPADTYFPVIDPKVWSGELMFSHPVDDRHAYSFDVYHYTRSSPSSV